MEQVTPFSAINRCNCSLTTGDAVRYVAITYTEHVAEAAIDLSVGSVEDRNDNGSTEAVSSSMQGLGDGTKWPWRSFDVVEYVTLE